MLHQRIREGNVKKIFAYEIAADNELINGQWHEVEDAVTSIDGHHVTSSGFDHRKRWSLDDEGEAVEYVDPAAGFAVERARIDAGVDAQAEIAVAMKTEGGVLSQLSEANFEILNDLAAPISAAMLRGQFVTALGKWRRLFSNPSSDTANATLIHSFIQSSAFTAGLGPDVESVLIEKIKTYDGLTDAQIAAI